MSELNQQNTAKPRIIDFVTQSSPASNWNSDPDDHNIRFVSAGSSEVPKLRHVRGDLESPKSYNFPDNGGSRKLLGCIRGTGLCLYDSGERKFFAPGSIALMTPHSEWNLLLGKGQQLWIVCDWMPGNPAIPDSKLGADYAFHISDCGLATRAITNQIAGESGDAVSEPNLIFAWLNLLIHDLPIGSSSFLLTPGLPDGTKTVASLVDQIRAKPTHPWSLTTAAKLAGYSPFHLSRIFRAVAGMGFPEYVDRSRIEVALNLLLDTKEPSTVVSAQSGFGTPQAMRQACLQYTGFLPSEIRAAQSTES